MNDYTDLAQAIITKQVTILGKELALDRARRVSGCKIDDNGMVVAITGDKLSVVGDLVESYQQLLGEVAITFSQEAAKTVVRLHPDITLPAMLTT